MSHSYLPPSGLFEFSIDLLFDSSIPDREKLFLSQLLVLTWGNKSHPSHQTRFLTYEELARLVGKSTRFVHNEITALQKRIPELRFLEDKDGFIFIAPDRYFASKGSSFHQKTQNLPQKMRQKQQFSGQENASEHDFVPPVLKEEVKEEFKQEDINSSNLLLSTSSSEREPENSRESGASNVKKPEKAERPPLDLSKTRIISGPVKDALLAAGIFPALMPEVACSGYSDDELLQLLDWVRDTQPQNPAPLFMARLRHGARAPAQYAQTVCKECGQRGGHAPGCRTSWLEGPYGYVYANQDEADGEDYDDVGPGDDPEEGDAEVSGEDE